MVHTGSELLRRGGGAFVVAYSLEAVYTPDDDPTEFVENLSFAPEKMILSR